jgi:hypothetical protein
MRLSAKAKREEVITSVSQPLVNDQRHMGVPIEGGDRPGNQGLSEFKVLRERQGLGPRIQKPDEPKRQPSSLNNELSEYYSREQERHSGILVNPIRVPRPLPQNPSEQRGEVESSKPTPVEQQTPQRRRSQRELARLAQDPGLRSLADELWGKALRKGTLTDTIKTALYQYSDLPPDEALKRNRDEYQGFSFASGEQGGEGQPFQPSEQQPPQRRRTRHERARLAQVPQLRELAKELFDGITEEDASDFIDMAVHHYPGLPPDKALRKLDRDHFKGDWRQDSWFAPFASGAQKEQRQPSQPNRREQQATERLEKSSPQSGEQEIEALLPSYFDYDDRQRVSMRFDPDRDPGTEPGDRLPESHGWDNLAEVLLDFSGFLSKPEDPTIHPDDYEGKLRSYRVAMLLGARGWEKETVKNLEAQGREDLIPQFQKDMQEYRKAAKGIITVWRKRGLL